MQSIQAVAQLASNAAGSLLRRSAETESPPTQARKGDEAEVKKPLLMPGSAECMPRESTPELDDGSGGPLTSSASSSGPLPTAVEPQPVAIGRWILLPSTLGHGSRSKVKLGHLAGSPDVQVAFKRVDKKRMDSNMHHELENEIRILRDMRHPHIIRLLDVLEDRRFVYLVFEHKAKDMYTYVSERRRLPELEARHLFFQIVSAVQHCHRNGVCHRDIKLENILVDRAGENAYLADFGFATNSAGAGPMTKYCGSPFTVAPEIVSRTPYSRAVDVWSLGVVLYGMVLGRFPFDEKTPRRLFARILAGRYHHLPAWVPEDLRNLLEQMLVVDPAARIPLDDILLHKWFWQNHVEGATPADVAFSESSSEYEYSSVSDDFSHLELH